MTKLSYLARKGLLDWFRASARDLPWRHGRTPYRVWVSEVMLQQTRVETVLPYYQAFLGAFPTVEDLAAAPEDELMARWAGLGYYRRARNLQAGAREVVAAYGGRLPDNAEGLSRLPGFGPYTTAAVGSLAFGLPLAVLDGNVIRVLARLGREGGDVSRPAVRRRLQESADALLERAAPGEWNEALMELGARVCLPGRPRCGECPLRPDCAAAAHGDADSYPRKTARGPVPRRAVLLLLVEDGRGRVLARRRPAEGMLGGLWELPGGELPLAGGQPPDDPWQRLQEHLLARLAMDGASPEGVVEFDHVYSHFRAHVRAAGIRLGALATAPGDHQWLDRETLARLGFSARDRRVLAMLHGGGS